MDKASFRNPSTEYRGVTLWMLNDKLQVREIRRQLKGFHKAGWGAVIGRTFNGLRTDYLSEAWMKIIGTIIDGSSRFGMRVWLQAGYMPSAVPDLDPATAIKGLTRRPLAEPVGPGEVVLHRDDQFAYIEKTETTVLDLLNGDAVVDYLDLAYKQPWQSRFGQHFGKTVEAVWVDEPHFRPPLLPWSSRVPDAFRRQWGYDVADHLPELFGPVGDFRRIRHQFWRTVTGLFLEGYFQRVGQWCREHNVKFSGHLMGEDTLNNQVAWTGATMPCYEHMQLPGIDHLTMSLSWPTGKKFLLTPKQCSSVASQLGIPEVLAEVYGVSSQGITFEDRKQIAQWMMVLGINYRCYHGSFYSMRGRRKRIYVPHLSHQQPWWPDNRLVSDYFARLSYALRRGQTRADVLVMHPVESAMCLFDPTTMGRPHDRSTEANDVRDMDTHLVNLCDHLQQTHRGWEFGDETIMARHGRVADGRLHVGRMSYRTVILPWMLTLRRTTLDLLEQFIAAGGTVLSAGPLPTRVDGIDAPQLAAFTSRVRQVENSPQHLAEALDAIIPAELRLASTGAGNVADVWVQERQLDEGRLIFLTNTSRASRVQAEVHLRGRGQVECWDLASGRVTRPVQRVAGDTVILPLELAPVGSCLWLLREAASPRKVDPKPWRVARTIPLAGPWQIRRDQPNALTLDVCRWRKGDGPWSESNPVIALQSMLDKEAYRGPLSMRFDFQVDDVPQNLAVVVEDAERYDIRINGQAVRYQGQPSYMDDAFHPVDISGHVRAGGNTIELSINFEPVPRATFALASLYENTPGVELESIYLVGDFAVRSIVSQHQQQPRCARLAPQFALTTEPDTVGADLVSAGYPFYAGRATLSQNLTLDDLERGQKLILALPRLDAVLANVRVNGRKVGSIAWAPYEIDITRAARAGRNEIEIELVGSLRNLLGPHHRSSGEPTSTWHTAFNYNTQDVEHSEERDGHWVDDYFVMHFGLGGTPQVNILQN